ncbi:MAG: pyridoxal-phosphate-dependent aminotransferase family protein [bacterium]
MVIKKRIFAPGPTPVPEETRQCLAETPPYHRSLQFKDLLNTVRCRLQMILNVDWPLLLNSSSGSGAMQQAVHHLVNSGDRVLVVDSGKFGRRWEKLLERRGCRVLTCRVNRGCAVDPAEISSMLDKYSDIKAVFATLVETSTLVRHPVEKIGKLLADNPALFVVDAISAIGAEPLYPLRWNIDVLVGASQKGLMAPPGISFLALSPAAQKRAKEVENPDLYFDINTALDRLNKDGQTPWTPPVELVRALAVSLQLLFDEGLENVYARHRQLSALCIGAVCSLGLEVFSQKPARAGTAVLMPADINAEKLRDLMYCKYNVFLPGGQQELEGRIIRIGHLGYVDYFDLLTVFSALELALVELGFNLEPGSALAAMQREKIKLEGI